MHRDGIDISLDVINQLKNIYGEHAVRVDTIYAAPPRQDHAIAIRFTVQTQRDGKPIGASVAWSFEQITLARFDPALVIVQEMSDILNSPLAIIPPAKVN